jgi:hypothetical protein
MKKRTLLILAGAVCLALFAAYQNNENKKRLLREEAAAAWKACGELEVTKGLWDRQNDLELAAATADLADIDRALNSNDAGAFHEQAARKAFRQGRLELAKAALIRQDFRDNAAAWKCRDEHRAKFGTKRR